MKHKYSISIFVFYLGLLPVLLLSSVFGFPDLDEGLIIQWSKSMSEGQKLYQDLPVVYGPIFFEINTWIFKNFGFLHFTSRLSALALGLLTFTFMTLSVRELTKRSFYLSSLGPLVWLFSSSARFSESLHPGWYIALILSVISYLLVKPNRNYVLIAALIVLLMGFKPHIGVLTFLGVFQALLLEPSRNKLLKTITTLLYFACNMVVLESAIVQGDFMALLPFILGLYFWLRLTLDQSIDLDKQIKVATFAGYIIVFCILFFIFLHFRYDVLKMKDYMFVLPKLKYSSYVTSKPTLEETLLLNLILLSSITIFTRFKNSIVYPFILLAASLMLTVPTLVGLSAFVLMHFLILAVTQNKYNKLLLIISIAQLLHLYPIAGTQLYYSSVVIWVLLSSVFLEESYGLKLVTRGSKLLIIQLIVIIINLPIARNILNQKKFIQMSSFLNNKEFILLSESEMPLLNLVKYYHTKEKFNQDGSEKTLFTLPTYYSLNLLTGLKPPSNHISHFLDFAEEEKLDKILEDVKSSNFALIFPKSNRAFGLQNSDSFDGKVYKYFQLNFNIDRCNDNTVLINNAVKCFKKNLE